jgi:succinoglycan biosynthesis protein ExoM
MVVTGANMETSAGTFDGLAVGLCTYKRLPSLQRLLEHIAVSAASLPVSPQIIVVDNDGNDPAVAEAVMAFAERTGLKVHHFVERQPGISAARNLVFDTADRLKVRFVAMIDDDEWPSAQWLTALLAEQARTGASVVGGPVAPVFPPGHNHLAQHARYWSVQEQTLEGRPFVFCTCNFLIDMAAIAQSPRPLFDDAFGLSGGGDTVFFRTLFYSGHQMAWTAQALVHEEVPESRASFHWLRQRRYRVGNHAVRWEGVGSGPVRSLLKTLGLSVRLLFYPLLRREPESPMVGWLLEYDKVRGRYAAHWGDVFVEYARTPAPGPGEKACR